MARARTLPPRDQIADNAPLRLDIAAALAFPDGSMTASGLRREAGRGRLAIERVAGKDYTPLGAIREMRQRWRVEAREPDCGCSHPAGIDRGRSLSRPYGSSATVPSSEALVAARAKLRKLSGRSPNTSPTNTEPLESGSAIPLPAKWPT